MHIPPRLSHTWSVHKSAENETGIQGSRITNVEVIGNGQTNNGGGRCPRLRSGASEAVHRVLISVVVHFAEESLCIFKYPFH